MCGIAVAIDWDGAEDAVKRLIGGILHRGDVTDPVAALSARTAFCTRRLRIVDAEHGVQPQLSADGRILVAFNGEIYNHATLRTELAALGVRFQTRSDTEVLANALAVWGGGALGRLRGMFAFVAIDLKSGQFVAARDPMGEKPLYLIQSETGFLFCSEIKPLLNATAEGEVLLLPPGYVLTKSYCKPFASLPQRPESELRPGSPKRVGRPAFQRRRSLHPARSALRHPVQRRYRQHACGSLRAAARGRRRQAISSAERTRRTIRSPLATPSKPASICDPSPSTARTSAPSPRSTR